jgi:N-acetylneuraminic acid mutarotase
MRLFCAALLLPFLSLQAETAVPQAPPPLPLPVASFGATAIPSGDVFIYGGHSGVRHKYNREEVHGTLHRWQAGTAAWEKLGTDEPAQGASLVATDKGIIRIGGMAARNEKGAKQDLWSSETAAIYNVEKKTWQALPKLPERRSSHDSAVIGNTLYVIGGWALMGGSDLKWHNTYLTLDLSKPDAQWQTHSQPFERRGLAALAAGTKVYAIGGMDSGDSPTSAVSVLDTTTGKWSEGSPLPADKLGGFGFAAVSHEGRVFASGAPGVLLELRGEEWVGITKLEQPRFFHRLVTAGPGKLIALGGESKQGKKTTPEVIALPPGNSAPLAGVAEAKPVQ